MPSFSRTRVLLAGVGNRALVGVAVGALVLVAVGVTVRVLVGGAGALVGVSFGDAGVLVGIGADVGVTVGACGVSVLVVVALNTGVSKWVSDVADGAGDGGSGAASVGVSVIVSATTRGTVAVDRRIGVQLEPLSQTVTAPTDNTRISSPTKTSGSSRLQVRWVFSFSDSYGAGRLPISKSRAPLSFSKPRGAKRSTHC